MPFSTYLTLGLGELAHTKLTVDLADRTVKYPKRISENILVGIGKFVFPVEFIILDMLEDIKVPLILRRPFLSTAHAKIDVFKRKITLRVRDEKNIFKSMKPASSLIKRVYMLCLRERMELDLEARLMGETLVLNKSLNLLYGDYIKLNDLNVPLELMRDQVDDLMPIIEEVQTLGSGISILLAVGTPSTGSGNLYCQWELSPGSGNALCILFPTESFNEYHSFCDFDQKLWKIWMATKIKTWEISFLEKRSAKLCV
uniref:Reverse transcriptase domain-containing protein n=1 Tax=Tanacetum cinerariifolium TaxID=118510 RepID=A0A6L2KHU6_TANCI|nr:hypothetical protein [Tanacetum cinerariifolium]